MKPGKFEAEYDGTSLSATITVVPTLALKISLYLLNILIIGVIILFTFGGIGVIVLFIVAFEVLFLRYSIWNIHGSERVSLTKDGFSYQLHYGPFKLPEKTFKINGPVRVIPFHDNFQTNNKAMKLIFESKDEQNEPVNLYQTAFGISQESYVLLMKSINQLYSH